MDFVSEQKKVQHLLRAKFPGSWAPPPISPVNSSSSCGGSADDGVRHRKMLSDIKAEEAALWALSAAERDALYTVCIRQEQIRAQLHIDLEESLRFFNRRNAVADCDHWSKAEYWTLDESVALLLGRAPERVKWSAVKAHVNVSAFAKEFERLRNLALRASALNQGISPSHPTAVLSWADSIHFTVPSELRAALEARLSSKQPPVSALPDHKPIHDETESGCIGRCMTSKNASHLKSRRTQEIRGTWIEFREVPFLIASAIYEGEDACALAEANIRANLAARVESGSLMVRNRDTMQPLTLPAGEQIKRAVLWPAEARHLFEERGIALHIIEEQSGPEFWTVGKAALCIGAQEVWDNFWSRVGELCEHMLESIADGTLPAYDPLSGFRYRQGATAAREFYELVKPADVNCWLATRGADYRWDVPAPEAEQGEGNAISEAEPIFERQDRRLARLRARGGNVERRSGGAWVQCGQRGVLTKLVAEEKAAGRSHSDRKDVSDDLSEAAEREHGNAT